MKLKDILKVIEDSYITQDKFVPGTGNYTKGYNQALDDIKETLKELN